LFSVGLILLGALLLASCAQVAGTQAAPGLPPETSIAQTVAAFPLPTLPPTAFIPTLEPAVLVPPPTFPPQATYTPLPTYTPQPTYTPFPTYTLEPTAVPQVIYPTVPYYDYSMNPGSTRPYVLRVRNQNQKMTLWIGTAMPYGGNFIKPLYYVEFYPPQPQWMRIWWCRSGSYPSNWEEHWWGDWEDHWDDPDVYSCFSKDIFVDQPFQEIGVK